jgi:DsbC/DsbD-like thiol-disulfide interchange protein
MAAESEGTRAHGTGAIDGGNPRVEARLLVDHIAAIAGEDVRVGVHFKLDRGWHIYWRNPGDAGLPTRLEWKIDHATVDAISAPAPRVFSEGPLTTFGYAGDVLLSNAVRFSQGEAERRRILVTAKFLACRVQCVPGRIELQGEIRVGARSIPAPDDTQAIFDEFAARVPRTPADLGLEIEAVYSQSAIRPGDSFLAALLVRPSDGTDDSPQSVRLPRQTEPDASFISDRLASFDVRASGTRPHPTFANGFLVNIQGQRANKAALDAPARLRGVLPIQLSDVGERWVEVDVPIPTAAAGTTVTAIGYSWLAAALLHESSPPPPEYADKPPSIRRRPNNVHQKIPRPSSLQDQVSGHQLGELQQDAYRPWQS